jgi:hypothetical protein
MQKKSSGEFFFYKQITKTKTKQSINIDFEVVLYFWVKYEQFVATGVFFHHYFGSISSHFLTHFFQRHFCHFSAHFQILGKNPKWPKIAFYLLGHDFDSIFALLS